MESELFGHEKGAFTNAIRRKRGKFELADSGSIFLDEIGDVSENVQVKLLRVLQEKEIRRIAGKTKIMVDVRVLTATNRDIEVSLKNEEFRSDLYYRLNEFMINLPQLKERKEDILFLEELINGNAKLYSYVEAPIRRFFINISI